MRFETPTNERREELALIFAQLPIVAPAICGQSELFNEFTTCDRDELIDVVWQRILDDYAENCAEAQSVSWKFDYVVEQEVEPFPYLAIMTRLYRDDTAGNILYGEYVARVGTRVYALADQD